MKAAAQTVEATPVFNFATLGDHQNAPAEAVTFDTFRGEDKPFLIVSFGMGRDSTAMLIKLSQLGIRPDLILTADTGAERGKTYEFVPVMNEYLRSVGFPEITMVDAGRVRDNSIEAHCLRLGIFPALSYGKHNCSVIWKIEAQNRHLATHQPFLEAKKAGRLIVKAIGFEKGEEYRAARAGDDTVKETAGTDGCKKTTAFAVSEEEGTTSWFPLIEAGIDFDGVLDIIFREKLPLPPKSSCFFCAGMTEPEVYDLSRTEPHLFFRSLVLERIVQRNMVVLPRRIVGIRFGSKWSDYEFAAPYESRIDEVIDIFGLDRAIADGERSVKSNAWRPKAERVELFRETFSTGEKLAAFMSETMDLSEAKAKVAQINLIERTNQMALPM